MIPCGVHPWDLYEIRVVRAISRAEDEHESLHDLCSDLLASHIFLTHRGASLDEIDSPVANNLRQALARHREEDAFRFDDHYAAELLLVFHSALEPADGEDQ